VPLEIGPLRPDEAEAALRLRARTFTTDPSPAFDPADPYVPDDRRIGARVDGRLVGHLAVWPFAQVFGGSEVPMGGVGGVAVAADQRGRGVGSRLLADGLALMREHGDAVSTLYPATVAPYRAWGWALAGCHDIRELPTRALASVPAPATTVVRPGREADLPACIALAQKVARTEPGGLVATEGWYRRRFEIGPDGDGMDVAERDGEVVGFAEWGRTAVDAPGWRLDVGLVVGRDADADRALWRQLGSWWSVAPTARVVSHPTDPLVVDLPELDSTVRTQAYWMTRLVDAPDAVAARGYPVGVTASVPLRLHDDRLHDNDGAFVLEVADGVGALVPGGTGRVHVDVRDLAPLWTGFLPARVLARRGALAGATADDVAALADAFDAPTPWMREYF
jgi:predicted acetyltransferase